jgi:Kef-type K+ transport system membrane component KefB
MDLARGLDTLLVAAVVAALAPVVVALLPGPRIPQVVVLLAGGVVAGPEVLGWAERAEIDLLANVGLGFLSCWPATSSTSSCSRSGPGGWPSRPGW